MEDLNPETLLRRAQALGEDIKEMEAINVADAYRRASTKLKNNRRKKVYDQVMRYAAFLTIPLLFSSLVLGYLYLGTTHVEQKYAEVVAAAGSVIRYELPDHSIVWLNSGSSLRFPTVFNEGSRNVELSGEAYFEVEADRSHPFYVNTTSGLSVFVYGTKFNVNAYEDDNFIETVLEKGKVNIIAPDGKTTVELDPGERLLYNKCDHNLLKDKVDVYEKVAWKDGKLIFRDAELSEIFKRLERHFNVDIQFNNISGKQYKYRATFRNETLPQILDYLAKSAALKWRTEEAVQKADKTFTKRKIIVDLY